MLELRPTRATNVASAFPGAVGLVLGVLLLAAGAPLLALPLLVAGGFLAYRMTRMAVLVQPDQVLVRGALWSRTIPRASIVALTDYPSLCWRAPSGRLRRTPLTALASATNTLPAIKRHNAANLTRLRKTLGL